ncbi:MAG: VOC family protein [Xanthobacteraceae bacterium]
MHPDSIAPAVNASAAQRRQLPVGGEIFLDHVAHFVRDPDAAARALARAGFTPTPPSIQINPDPGDGAPRPTGTGNITAMLAEGYIEALFKSSDTALAAELESAIRRYCGLHLVAFAVPDATAAHRRLASAGFRVRPLVHMARPVATVSGTGRAAFTVARVEPAEMAEGRIQMLTHHTEQMVWQPRWLTHPNGALALQRVVIAVEDVQDAAKRYARFTGRKPSPLPSGCRLDLDRGRIDLVSRAGFERMLPEIAIPSLPFIGACEIRVASLPKLKESLDRGRLRRTAAHPDGVLAVFPEELGLGAWLFRE